MSVCQRQGYWILSTNYAAKFKGKQFSMFSIDFKGGFGNTNLNVILSKLLSETYFKCSV